MGRGDAEQLWVGHEHGCRALAQRGEGRCESCTRGWPDAHLWLTVEVRDCEPAAVELPDADVHLHAKISAHEASVRADEVRLLSHALTIATDCDISSVAMREVRR